MKFFLKIFFISVQLLVLVVCEDAFDYCSLNENVCENVPHVACGTLQVKLQRLPLMLRTQINVTTEPLSDTDKGELISLINGYRNKIALGLTRLPKGSNLHKTVWDDELETIAKSLSEIQLIADESGLCYKRRDGKPVYINLLRHDINPKTASESVQDIKDNMEKEKENEGGSIEALKEVAHLTKLGCYFGYANIVGKSDVYQGGISCVMDYEMDRLATHQAYTEGEPCTKCKNDVGCDSDYPGLCAVP